MAALAGQNSVDILRFVGLFHGHGPARDQANVTRQFARRCDSGNRVFRVHFLAGFAARALERKGHDHSLGRALLGLHDGRFLALRADVPRRAASSTGGPEVAGISPAASKASPGTRRGEGGFHIFFADSCIVGVASRIFPTKFSACT